jgi:hypothetical protein
VQFDAIKYGIDMGSLSTADCARRNNETRRAFFCSFPGRFAGLEIVRARGAGKQEGPLAVTRKPRANSVQRPRGVGD